MPNINSHDIVVAIYTCYMLWKLLEHVVRTWDICAPATQCDPTQRNPIRFQNQTKQEPKNIDCDEYQIDFPKAVQFGDTRQRNRRRSVMVSTIS